MIKNKTAELTTKQLVTLIILIVSFIVILFLIFRLDLGGTTDKEICHNSIVMKAQVQVAAGPLDCRTSYVCISGGDDCAITKTATKIEVDSTNKSQIMQAITDEMADCWWMFGEGKIDYESAGTFDKVSCSICSIIEFDNKVQDKIQTISYTELYNYLKTTQKSSSQSYLQYIYSSNTLNIFQEFNLKNYLINNIDTRKEYFILTGMAKEGYLSLTWNWNPFSLKNTPYPVVIMEKIKENYDAVGCTDFVTKS